MDSAEFREMWSKLGEEQSALEVRRNNLEMELQEVRNKLLYLQKVRDNLLPLSDLAVLLSEMSQLGLTDAIRKVLQDSKGQRLTPTEIRDTLLEQKYDLSGLTEPMASVYKILSRLAEKPEEVQRDKEKGRIYYTWIGEVVPF